MVSKFSCYLYKQGEDKRRFSMYLFLPDAKDRSRALVMKMRSQFAFLKDHIPYKMIEVVDFKIPRFKISFGIEVSSILKALGLLSPFSRKRRWFDRDGGFPCGFKSRSWKLVKNGLKAQLLLLL